MKIVLKSVAILLIALVVTGLYWFGKAALYKHEAKQAVMNYLHRNYRGLEFKITNMHHGGFFGSPMIGRDFSASVETKINSKQVNFLVWTDAQGKVNDYADTLAQDKLKVDAEDDVRAEVKTLIPSLKGVSLDVYYDARTSGSSPLTVYSRGMNSLMLKSIGVSWKEDSDLAKADFIHKSVQLGKQLTAKKFSFWRVSTSYSVNGTTKMSLELLQSELDLPDEQLLEKISISTTQ